MAVATNVTEDRQDDHGGRGLDGVLHALAALCPSVGAPSCCTWVCSAVVVDVRRRCLGAAGRLTGSDLPGLLAVPGLAVPGLAVPGLAVPGLTVPGLTVLEFPDLEFEAVLVRRLANRYLKVVADARAGRPVPRAWQLLHEPPPVSPTRLALAGVGTLLDYDLTLALVGACTVLGRTPGGRERDSHARVAAVLGTCIRELVRRAGDPDELRAARRLDSPATRDAAWLRAEHLWTLRGRPAETEEERDALDRAVAATVTGLLAG